MRKGASVAAEVSHGRKRKSNRSRMRRAAVNMTLGLSGVVIGLKSVRTSQMSPIAAFTRALEPSGQGGCVPMAPRAEPRREADSGGAELVVVVLVVAVMVICSNMR